MLTGLRRLDGDTIASRDGPWAIDLRLGIGPENLLGLRLGLGLANRAARAAARDCGITDNSGPGVQPVEPLGHRAYEATRAAAETLASPCSTARTGSGTPSSSSVLAAWTVARLTWNGLAASSRETA